MLEFHDGLHHQQTDITLAMSYHVCMYLYLCLNHTELPNKQ